MFLFSNLSIDGLSLMFSSLLGYSFHLFYACVRLEWGVTVSVLSCFHWTQRVAFPTCS